MNPKSLIACVIMLAFTVLVAPAQSPAPSLSPTPAPVHAGEITVNVLGQVNQQARVTLPPGSTMLDALAAAGGISKIGNPERVILIHKTSGAKPDSVRINMKPILAGIQKDIKLRDGDTIIVGEAIF